MFDGILKNMLTDILRMVMTATAGYLGLTGTDQQKWIAGGMAIGAGLWAWYENHGHQLLVDQLKTIQQKIPQYPNPTAKAVILLPFLLLFAPHVAHAQILKAPAASSTCTVTNCPNMFWLGGGLGGVGSNIDIIGSGLDNSVFADGMAPFADAEWMNWNGTVLLGVDIGGGYQFAQPTSIGGNSANQSGGIGWMMAEAGGSLSQLFGQSTPVTILGALQTNLITLYGAAGPVFSNGTTLPGLRAGAKYLVGPNLQLDMAYTYANDQKDNTKNVQLVTIGLKYGFQP
jgi:hypothetical protein